MALAKHNVFSVINSGISAGSPHIATENTTVPAGSDRVLIVIMSYLNTNTLSTVTYNTDSMTKFSGWATDNLKIEAWYLVAPDVGVGQEIKGTFVSGSGTVGVFATAFSGADQTNPIRQQLHSTKEDTPNSKTINILQDSMVMGVSASINAFESTKALEIDGNQIAFTSCDQNGNCNGTQFAAHTYDGLLDAGDITVISDTIADSFQADNARIEIAGAGGGPVTRRRIWVC